MSTNCRQFHKLKLQQKPYKITSQTINPFAAMVCVKYASPLCQHQSVCWHVYMSWWHASLKVHNKLIHHKGSKRVKTNIWMKLTFYNWSKIVNCVKKFGASCYETTSHKLNCHHQGLPTRSGSIYCFKQSGHKFNFTKTLCQLPEFKAYMPYIKAAYAYLYNQFHGWKFTARKLICLRFDLKVDAQCPRNS